MNAPDPPSRSCGSSSLCLLALTVAWDAIGAPVSLITQIAIYTLYGAGVNLLVGYTGLVPFGASVFFGCASYAVGDLDARLPAQRDRGAGVRGRCSRWCSAAAIALIILRRRGLYFSLLTLAFSQIAFEIAFKWTDLTGGENGLQGVPRPWFAGDWAFHVFTVVSGDCSACGCCGGSRMRRSAACLQALRDNEQRVQSLGYNDVPHQVRGVRHHGRRGRLRRRTARVHAARRLCRQSRLAACRRCAADDGTGRRAPLPRAALGRHRLHPAAGPAVARSPKAGG